MRSQGSYKSAVDYLKLHDPVLFGPLNESTVRGWFQPGSYKFLTPNLLAALKRGSTFYKPMGSGMRHCLENFPNICAEIKELLQSLRISGTNLLQLSRLYSSCFSTANMLFTHRCCTKCVKRANDYEGCITRATPGSAVRKWWQVEAQLQLL